MNLEDFLDFLSLGRDGEFSKEGTYVIDLESSDDFGKIYSKLDSNDDLEYLDSYSLLTVDNASLIYRYEEDFQVGLIADFNNNLYKVVIEKL